MGDDDVLIRDVSDTARWMAAYRADETERADAAFKDPFARRLAGERGHAIARAMTAAAEHAWSFTARTYLFDRYVTRLVKHGVDLIVNLAAGLDTRPYRMALPASLRWVEVDLPEILDYKETMLGDEKASCALERVRLDLANEDARRGLFERLGRDSKHAAILSEGLLIYLMPFEVGVLARDLAAPAAFHHWVIDLVSPSLLDTMRQQVTQTATAPFLFAPPEGPRVFTRYGWSVAEVRTLLKAAGKLGRLPLMMRAFALLPEADAPRGSMPWSAVCLLSRGGQS
jgi:methyltransferase (TIGR00027 family)